MIGLTYELSLFTNLDLCLIGVQSWQGEDVGIGPKIPQALEKILQLKEMRQEQLSIAPTGHYDCQSTGFISCLNAALMSIMIIFMR